MTEDTEYLFECLSEIYESAEQMMENATYMQKEFPNISMPDHLREQLNELCNQLIKTKHDLFNEIDNCHELIVIDPDSPITVRSMNRITQLENSSKKNLRACVKAVQLAISDNTASPLLEMLLLESACNIFGSSPAYRASLEKSENQEDQNDEDLENSDDDPNCYAFYCEDFQPIGQLVSAIRSLAERPELSAETLESLKVFLFAMQRLPLVTPGVRMSLSLTLRLDLGRATYWIEIRMEDGKFSLGRGWCEYGDTQSDIIFEVTTDTREGDTFAASQFAQTFAECAEDCYREVMIKDSSDEPFQQWDLNLEKSRWSKLPSDFL